MQFYNRILQIQRHARMCYKPSEHLSVLEILFAVLIRMFPCIFVDQVIFP